MALTLQAQQPANGIQSLSTYQTRYGTSNSALEVDPNKELPRYPALEPKEAIASWKLKKGFKLEFAAHEPQVVDPIAICFDEKGRMFVCEMIDYSEQRDVTPHLGRVSMLEDKDGDGYYETSTIFADNLAWPTGLIWANNQLFVIATPDIWSFKDADGDGKAERREKIYTGFGTGLEILNVQGMANSPQWGQDNRIHILSGGGNRGKVSCVKRPDLPAQELSGQDFWFDPVTLEFGLEPGGAQYGMSFDDFGRKFACSNSDHLQYWIHDGRYTHRNPHYRLPNPRQSIAADGGAAEVFRISPDEPWRILRTRWRISGMVKGAVEGGGRVSGYFTGASGTTMYRGDALGPDFLNNSLSGDAGGQLAHRKKITYAQDGINLTGKRPKDETHFEFAASNDTWVRVVNFANAPDGCFYICDMYREVIEHPWSIPEQIKQHIDLNNGNTRGRLYRIAPDNKEWQRRGKIDLGSASTLELVKTLKEPNGWHRDTAHRLLFERQDQSAVTELRALLKDPNASEATKLHVLGVLQSLKALDDASLKLALLSEQPHLVERAIGLANLKLLLQSEIWTHLFKTDRTTFSALLVLGDASEPSSQIVTRFAEALKSDKEWLHAAVYSAQPALAAHIIQESIAQNIPGDRLAPLMITLGAENQEKDLNTILGLVAKQPITNQTTLAAALAEGLRKAKSNLAKADQQGLFQTAFNEAEKTALNTKANTKERAGAIALLGLSTLPSAKQTLLSCLGKEQSAEVQSAAIQTLGQHASADLASKVLPQWSQLQNTVKQELIELMISRPKLVNSILQSIDQPESPKASDLNASQIQSLIKHRDAAVAKLANLKLASVIPPSRKSVIEKFQSSLQLPGDQAKGKVQFQMRCMACHIAEGAGVQVGPDLVTVKTRGQDALLEAIIDPHKEVAPQYIAYQFQTKDGRTFYGAITQDDAQAVTLKMMGGMSPVISRSDIQSSSSSGQSLMPEGLEGGMSPQDMADLLKYIESL